MSNKKSLGLVLVILGFVLIALVGIRTISNPDIFTHIALGQAGNSSADTISYTMGDQQWINMNPLYNKLASGLWGMGGAALVTLAHVAALLAAFILMFQFGKKMGLPPQSGSHPDSVRMASASGIQPGVDRHRPALRCAVCNAALSREKLQPPRRSPAGSSDSLGQYAPLLPVRAGSDSFLRH